MQLISDDAGIRAAQKQLVKDLKRQLPAQGRHFVTFRPSSAELDVLSHGNGRLYFGSRTLHDERKFWNAFGIFQSTLGKQEIVVEINFGLEGTRTAGFFGREGGRRFLLHTGGIGGGKSGVSQAAFMAWLKPEVVAVEDDAGVVRHGIVVGELGTGRLSDRIERFVRAVKAFKQAVADGHVDEPSYQNEATHWREYLAEFAGRKSGLAEYDLDYVSYHGDVVEALRIWREARNDMRLTVTNSLKIDLLAHRGGTLVEIYEVKTGTSRQTLYTAIGQLAVHGATRPAVAKNIVLPHGCRIPSDISHAFRSLSINLLTFLINADDEVQIVEPS